MKLSSVLVPAILAFCVPGFAQDHPAANKVESPVRGDGSAETGKRTPRYLTIPVRARNTTDAAHAATATTIPLWSNSVGTYTYTMVGADPSVAGSTGATVPTVIIPLKIVIGSTTFDPTTTTTCESTAAPSVLVPASPIFTASSYTLGGTSLGSLLFHDAFQRANFWKYTSSTGVSPNYHLTLTTSVGTALSLTVPALTTTSGVSTGGTTVTETCSNGKSVTMGEVDYGTINTFVTSSSVLSQVNPGEIPIFLLSNVVMYSGATSDCCILGFHSGVTNGSGTQYYAVADFDSTGIFGGTTDVSPLSHELGETLDDPSGANPTPTWGDVGQVSGCQSNLEVGDPLSGTEMPAISMPVGSSSYSFHLQELAFLSWFYRQSPSIGLNGWYSLNDTFKTYSWGCTASTTTLTVSPSSFTVGAAVSVSGKVAPSSGSGTPTGTVALTRSTGITIGTYTLSSGAYSATVSTLPAGSYTVTATYSGSATYAPSTASVSVTSGAPSVSFSPTSLSFGNETEGVASTAQTITLTNKGTAALSGIAISLTGGTPSAFSQTNTCPTGTATLAVNGTCSIKVVFNPATAGALTASVSVADNASGSPQTVALSGTGVAAAPAVTLSPSSLSFAGTTVGGASASQTVTLTNSGTAALAITSVALGGTNSGDFSDTNTCSGVTIAAKGTCTITVTFKPTATGSRTASITITDNASPATQTVNLSGTGAAAAPAVSLSATSEAFGSSAVTVATAAKTVTLTNSGTAALSITSVTLGGTNATDFTESTTCSGSIAAAGTCTITLTFKPTATGSRSATVSIADSATGSPQTISLTGTGTSQITLSASSFAFGSVTSGTTSTADTLTIKNVGTTAVTVTSIALSGSTADFAETNTCGTSIAAAGSCTASLTFKPASKASFTATLTITDSAAGSPQTVALTGTGK